MFKTLSIFLVLFSLVTARLAIAEDYPLKTVPFNQVEITGDFWKPRLETQQKTLVPFAFEKTQTGVEHLKAARDHLAGKETPDHRPHRFIDSDLYKVMEGAAYLLKLKRDHELESLIDQITDVIEGAQHADGYLYPSHTTGVGSSDHMMGDEPYTFIVHSHELYNVGHLYEAAIAYYQATGKRRLLRVAEKNAQHLNQVFFVGDPNYNDGKPIRQAPGHQELELALIKLYRVTGNKLYLTMAERFLEIRGVTYVPDGEGVMSPTYAQQHAPVSHQKEAVGHAVRATYMYSAMADIGTLTGKRVYDRALDQIWSNITDTRMHLTGGLGAVHGIEGFGPEYLLPNADAFNETCAAVGNVIFNYRMFLLHKDAKYLDVAEIALLNNVLASVNLQGNRFFYVNPLEADGKYPFNHGTAGRSPWFGTACCPSNMARLLPQVPGMTYAYDENSLYLTLYAASKTKLEIGGVPTAVSQSTSYPYDGNLTITLQPDRDTAFDLYLRIPTWAQDRFVPGELYRYREHETAMPQLTVNGEAAALEMERGFAKLRRVWKSNDKVTLHLPMPVRVTESHPAVKDNQGRVAFTRGPLVMCAEGVDNGGSTQRFFFDERAPRITKELKRVEIPDGSFQQTTAFGKCITAAGSVKPAEILLTPYYAWNNRGISSMTVWFPTTASMAVFDPHQLPKASIFQEIKASHTAEEDTVNAVGDGKVDQWSSGNKVPRWTSRGEPGKPQWVEGRFNETKTIRSVGVFWMDRWQGDVRLPRDWSLEIEVEGHWKPFHLYTTDRYDTRANQFNVVHPAAPVHADAIRINMTPQDATAVGIIEAQVIFEGKR